MLMWIIVGNARVCGDFVGRQLCSFISTTTPPPLSLPREAVVTGLTLALMQTPVQYLQTAELLLQTD